MRWSSVLAVLAIQIPGSIAVAEPPATEADQLFEQGRALMDAGEFEQACAKFEQSIAKDPRAIGTLMNLGLCNARAGKVATALGLFQEAHDRAAESGLDSARKASLDAIAELRPKIPVLVIKRAADPLPGEKLVVDDRVIAGDLKELPLDPGGHVVVVTAPGRLPFEQQVVVETSARQTLTIPRLELPSSKTIVREASTRRTVGKVTTFAGAGIALAGLGLGLYARRDYDQLFDDPDGAGPLLAACGAFPDIDGKPACDAAGHERAQRDRNLAAAGYVVGAIGLASMATGVVLWLTARDRETTTMVTPVVTPTGAGVVLDLSF